MTLKLNASALADFHLLWYTHNCPFRHSLQNAISQGKLMESRRLDEDITAGFGNYLTQKEQQYSRELSEVRTT